MDSSSKSSIEEKDTISRPTLQEIDIEMLAHGVKKPEHIKFRPLGLFHKKYVGLNLGVNVGVKVGIETSKIGILRQGFQLQ